LRLQPQNLQSPPLLSRQTNAELRSRSQQQQAGGLYGEIEVPEERSVQQRHESSERSPSRLDQQPHDISQSGDVAWKLPRLPVMNSSSTIHIETRSSSGPVATKPPGHTAAKSQAPTPSPASNLKRWSQVFASFWPYMNSW
jgi:hypothetical protein